MEKRIKQQLDMIRVVIIYCDNNTAATILILNFAITLASIKNKVILIDGYSLIADVLDRGRGVTLNANAIRGAGSIMALAVSGSLRAYAADPLVKNIELQELMSLTITDFTHVSKEACLNRMNDVHTQAVLFATQIANYGTTPTDITDLQAAVTLYGTAIGSSRTAQISRKQADHQRKQIISQIIENDLKNGLDALTLTLISKNRPFFDGYHFAREIIDSATIGTRISFRLMEDLIPVNDATSTITNLMVLKKPRIAPYPVIHSTPEGIVIHPHLGTGLFDILIQKENYQPRTLTGNRVKLGNALDLGDIKLFRIIPPITGSVPAGTFAPSNHLPPNTPVPPFTSIIDITVEPAGAILDAWFATDQDLSGDSTGHEVTTISHDKPFSNTALKLGISETHTNLMFRSTGTSTANYTIQITIQ